MLVLRLRVCLSFAWPEGGQELTKANYPTHPKFHSTFNSEGTNISFPTSNILILTIFIFQLQLSIERGNLIKNCARYSSYSTV